MRPDFTGVWKLIRGESDFGFLPPPEWRLDTIVHRDPQLRIRTRQKDANGDTTVDRDLEIGGPAATVMIRGRERQIRAFWDDTVLVVETRSEVSGNGRRIEDRRSLSPGSLSPGSLSPEGDQLIIERLHEQPGGNVRLCLRMRRQPPRAALRESDAVPMAPGSGTA